MKGYRQLSKKETQIIIIWHSMCITLHVLPMSKSLLTFHELYLVNKNYYKIPQRGQAQKQCRENQSIFKKWWGGGENLGGMTQHIRSGGDSRQFSSHSFSWNKWLWCCHKCGFLLKVTVLWWFLFSLWSPHDILYRAACNWRKTMATAGHIQQQQVTLEMSTAARTGSKQ